MPLDADDIDSMYRGHVRLLVTFFARRTFDAEAAAELAAETFAAAVADRAQFRGDDQEAAVAWLYGIARHRLGEWYRSARAQREALARIGLDPPGLSDAEYERIEELAGLAALRIEVADQLEELSEEQRAALQLRVVDERPYPEVAARLGVSEPTARARVSRGLRKLAARVELDAQEVGDERH